MGSLFREFVIGADSFGQLSSGIPNRILSELMYWMIVAIVMGILFIITRLLIVGIGTITKHLGNIYEEEELTREATCFKKEQVQIEGGREVKRNLDFYNLDAIIAVRFLRVKEEYPMSRLSKRLQRNMISSVCVRIRNMCQNLINKPKNISRVNSKQPRW